MKKTMKLLLSITALMVLLVTFGCSSSSDTTSETENESVSESSESGNNEKAKSNFPEKEITLIVPYSPGGGYDTAARLLAPYWEKYLPNDTSIIVENKPGGNGNIALGELTKTNPDGYTVGLVNLPGHFVNQVLGTASYDLTKFNYIGNITKTIYVAAASKKSGFTKLEDLQNAEEVVAGITSISSSDGLGVILSSEELGINVNTINHKGSTEAILSLTRGDASFAQFPVESLIAQFESGEIQPLWVYNDERLPELPDVPTIAELGHESLIDTVSMYRVIAAPADTPEDVLKILRDSFMEAVNDPEYKQKVIESGALWNPSDHKAVEKVAKNAYEMLKPHKQLLKENR